MKRLVEEVDGEGLEGLLGEYVALWCLNYIYAGKLVGVNDTCVKLDGARVVYETGELTAKTWKDAQPLPDSLYVQTRCIESFYRVGHA
jgi:hypothetical protein